MMTAVFAGFLCDLKGHKENLEWKGTGGNVACITCANLDKRIRGRNRFNVIGLDCSDPGKFVRRTNQDVFDSVDYLHQQFIAGISQKKIDELQTEHGFNVLPDGLLLDFQLREIFKPIDHTLRDWQHTVVGDGVANSVIGIVLTHLSVSGTPCPQ
jgi:hypothetical protein